MDYSYYDEGSDSDSDYEREQLEIALYGQIYHDTNVNDDTSLLDNSISIHNAVIRNGSIHIVQEAPLVHPDSTNTRTKIQATNGTLTPAIPGDSNLLTKHKMAVKKRSMKMKKPTTVSMLLKKIEKVESKALKVKVKVSKTADECPASDEDEDDDECPASAEDDDEDDYECPASAEDDDECPESAEYEDEDDDECPESAEYEDEADDESPESDEDDIEMKSSSDESADDIALDDPSSFRISDLRLGTTQSRGFILKMTKAEMKTLERLASDSAQNSHKKKSIAVDVSEGRDWSRSRYFAERPQIRCHSCKELGHLSKYCQKKRLVCLHCGLDGHNVHHCPSSVCYNCLHPGHLADDCEQRKYYQASECARCHMFGHSHVDCPDIWRQYHITVEAGSVIEGENAQNKRVFCFNCGRSGHYGYECRRPNMNRRARPLLPFIAKYQLLYDDDQTTSNKRRDQTSTRRRRDQTTSPRRHDKTSSNRRHDKTSSNKRHDKTSSNKRHDKTSSNKRHDKTSSNKRHDMTSSNKRHDKTSSNKRHDKTSSNKRHDKTATHGRQNDRTTCSTTPAARTRTKRKHDNESVDRRHDASKKERKRSRSRSRAENNSLQSDNNIAPHARNENRGFNMKVQVKVKADGKNNLNLGKHKTKFVNKPRAAGESQNNSYFVDADVLIKLYTQNVKEAEVSQSCGVSASGKFDEKLKRKKKVNGKMKKTKEGPSGAYDSEKKTKNLKLSSVPRRRNLPVDNSR